jgi:AbrB family looped-hinge helix DNA binding protein
MRVTEKGQVTVPKRIRIHLGIWPGTEVDFILKGDEVKLIRMNVDKEREGDSRGARMVRLLKEAASRYQLTDFTTGEIMDMTRGPCDDVNPR